MSETTELIKRLRASGLSQSEISRRTGIPQPRLSRWEGGEVPDAADDSLKLQALVVALDVSVMQEQVTQRGEPCTAIATTVAENPVACDDPALVDAQCLLDGDRRNENERYIGHKCTREGEKNSKPTGGPSRNTDKRSSERAA